MTKTYDELRNRLATIHDLQMAQSILGWDQHTKMPPKGGELRAEQLSTLDRFTHELFIDDEIGRLLDELRDYEESAGYDSDEASLIRITRRDYDKAKRVPAGAARRDDTNRRERAAGLDRGAREVGLLDLPAPSEEERRAHAPLHRLLRRHGLSSPPTTSCSTTSTRA